MSALAYSLSVRLGGEFAFAHAVRWKGDVEWGSAQPMAGLPTLLSLCYCVYCAPQCVHC